MTYSFEFKEIGSGGSEPCYLLILNGEIYRTYSKWTHSHNEAIDKAANEVSKAIKKYGADNVSYDEAYLYN